MAEETRPGPSDEDWVPEDDRVIGRVFRWSLVVLAAAALVVVAGWWLTRPVAAPPPVVEKTVGTVPDLAPETQDMPRVSFRDITAESGIRFVHVNGARGRKLLPETMGSGVGFFDHDGDGDQDLLFVNGKDWPGQGGGRRVTQALYRNDGQGRFEDVTAASGLGLEAYGMGLAVADYDGDGDQDVFFTALGPNHLFRNDGGRFTDVTQKAGVAGAADTWSTSAGFVDYDRDGDLDLFVCNYVAWSPDIDLELNFTMNGRDRAYGPPTNYQGANPYLYRNEGDGTFTDVAESAGIRVANRATGLPVSKALGVTFADTDRDGWPDIFVANDTVQNFLYHNRGDGTFEEIGATSGFGFDTAGKARGAMGIDAAHYRNDHQFGISVSNFANEMTAFYVAQGDGLQFTDEAMGEGIGSPTRLVLSFGLFFFDYDLDGRLDLLQANGHIESEINQVQPSQHYEQSAQLFWNAGSSARACYTEVPRESLGDLARPIVGRGAAYADIDADGDLDVVLTDSGGPALLLRNEQSLGHHWLRVRAVGAGRNRDAIGAWIELVAGGTAQRRQVMPTRSYLSQVELPVTFGLGQAERIDALRVVWPDGVVQEVEPPGVDRLVTVERSGSAIATGPASTSESASR